MNRLTNEQRLQIIEFYYQNACAAIRVIVTKFRTKFTLLDIKPPTRVRRVRTKENIDTDRPVLIMTINYRFIAVSSNWTFVTRQKKNFAKGFRPFKIQLVQELKPNYLPQRRIFGEWALGK